MKNDEKERKIKKGIELATKDFQDELTTVIYSSILPPVIIKFVLKELLGEVEKIEADAIQKQYQDFLNEKKRYEDSEKEKYEERKQVIEKGVEQVEKS